MFIYLAAPLAPSVHILSGDNQEAVSHMAALAGIEDAQVALARGADLLTEIL